MKTNLNEARIRKDSSWVGLQDHSVTDGSVECVFKDIDQRLVQEISKHDYVIGCVAWFTHVDILDALSKCRGVCVVVQKEDFLRPDGHSWSKARLRQRYERLRGIDRRRLRGKVAPQLSYLGDCQTEAVRCCGVSTKNKWSSPRCHHKFVVFCDEEIEHHEAVPSGRSHPIFGDGSRAVYDERDIKPVSVWTGSFNFTQNAVFSFENAVIISNPGIVRAYTAEFEQVLALSEPLDWKHEYVEPEYRIGT